MLSVLNFLHCPTPQAWLIDPRSAKSSSSAYRSLISCELKARKPRCCWCVNMSPINRAPTRCSHGCNLTKAFAFRQGPERILLPCIDRLAAPCRKLMTLGSSAYVRMVLLIKRVAPFLAGTRGHAGRNIPYVKITASRYAKGMLKAVRTHEPLTLIDKLICGAYIEAAPANVLPLWRHGWMRDLQTFYLYFCAPKRGIIRIAALAQQISAEFLRVVLRYFGRWKLTLCLVARPRVFVFIAACRPPDKRNWEVKI